MSRDKQEEVIENVLVHVRDDRRSFLRGLLTAAGAVMTVPLELCAVLVKAWTAPTSIERLVAGVRVSEAGILGFLALTALLLLQPERKAKAKTAHTLRIRAERPIHPPRVRWCGCEHVWYGKPKV